VTNAILCDSRLSAFPVRLFSSLSLTLTLLLSLSLSPSLAFFLYLSSSIALFVLVRSPIEVPLQEASVYCCMSSLALSTSASTSRELSANNGTLDCKHRKSSMRNPPASAIKSLLVEFMRSTKHVAAFGLVDR